jgi:hypothetical protein
MRGRLRLSPSSPIDPCEGRPLALVACGDYSHAVAMLEEPYGGLFQEGLRYSGGAGTAREEDELATGSVWRFADVVHDVIVSGERGLNVIAFAKAQRRV